MTKQSLLDYARDCQPLKNRLNHADLQRYRAEFKAHLKRTIHAPEALALPAPEIRRFELGGPLHRVDRGGPGFEARARR